MRADDIDANVRAPGPDTVLTASGPARVVEADVDGAARIFCDEHIDRRIHIGNQGLLGVAASETATLVRVTSRSLHIRCCICVGIVSPFLVARFVWEVGMALIAAFFLKWPLRLRS